MAAPGAVFTIARVADMLGEDVDWLSDVALEMDPEDGCLTVHDIDDEGTPAFASFGIARGAQKAYLRSSHRPTSHA